MIKFEICGKLTFWRDHPPPHKMKSFFYVADIYETWYIYAKPKKNTGETLLLLPIFFFIEKKELFAENLRK